MNPVKRIYRETICLIWVVVCSLFFVSCHSSSVTMTPNKSSTFFVPLCGGVQDAQVQKIVGTYLISEAKNPLGCVWYQNGALTPAIQFSAYRSSNYLKEIFYDRTGHGVANLVRIKNRIAVQYQTKNGVCETVIPTGKDFIVWTVFLDSQSVCQIGKELAGATHFKSVSK